MTKQKTIWHVGAWNRNYGDHVLQASIRENLMKVSDIPLNFVPVDCQNTHFFPELIDRMNTEADLLLVGGGGLIFNRSEDNSLSGWQFSIKQQDLQKIKIPIVIYGIGYNKFSFDHRDFKTGLNEHLMETQQRAALFSVRNHGTKRELIDRGLQADGIEVVPDAGSFLRPQPIHIPNIEQSQLRIGINWVSDRSFYTFPQPYEETKKEVILNVVQAFKYFVEKYKAQIYCIEHIPLLDKDIVKYMRKELGDNFVSIEQDMPYLFPPSLVFAPFLMDIYRQMDVVIGMRGHANIIPFGTRTPFIALGSHNKNKFFLEEVDEHQYLLDITNYKNECSVENVINKLEFLLKEKEDYKKRTEFKLLEMKTKFDAFNQKVINIIT